MAALTDRRHLMDLFSALRISSVDSSIVTLAAVAVLLLSLRIADGGFHRYTAGNCCGAWRRSRDQADGCILPGHAHNRLTGASCPFATEDSLCARGFALFRLRAGLAVALLLSPYYLLDWNEFRAALVEQSQELTGGYALVYTWQFIGTTPYAFEASNLANWSVGVAIGISGFAGWVLSVTRLALRRGELVPTLLLTLWPTLYFGI